MPVPDPKVAGFPKPDPNPVIPLLATPPNPPPLLLPPPPPKVDAPNAEPDGAGFAEAWGVKDLALAERGV